MFVEKAVTSYLVEREDSDARLAAAVHEWCEGEAITKFNDAASRADEDIVYEVVSCVEDLIASPSSRLAKGRKKNADPEILGPGNLNHHNSFRFHIYRKLAEKFGYQRTAVQALEKLHRRQIERGWFRGSSAGAQTLEGAKRGLRYAC